MVVVLPASVWTQKAVGVSFGDMEANPVYGDQVSKGLPQIAAFEDATVGFHAICPADSRRGY